MIDDTIQVKKTLSGDYLVGSIEEDIHTNHIHVLGDSETIVSDKQHLDEYGRPIYGFNRGNDVIKPLKALMQAVVYRSKKVNKNIDK